MNIPEQMMDRFQAAGQGIDYFSTANNHCYDYGEQGLLDTLDCKFPAPVDAGDDGVRAPLLGQAHMALNKGDRGCWTPWTAWSAGGRSIPAQTAPQRSRRMGSRPFASA